MRIYLALLTAILFFGCAKDSGIEKNINAVPITVEILRFDKVFGTAHLNDLPDLKRSYPIFFPKQFHDTIWEMKMNDSLTQQLYVEVMKKYWSERKLKADLEGLFKHIKYYFSNFKTPNVVTANSDVDYRNKIFIADNMLVISLDNYLGSDHFFYEGIPSYVVENMKESQIISDVASIYSQMYVPKIQSRTFLAQMIYYGRILYLKDLWLPNASDEVKIGYSQEKLKWIQENETEIWRNFVENEYLYSTNPKLVSRFIDPAPFSKFYLEIDNDSPGMVGRFIGWQIVKSYMDKNNVGLDKLLTISEEEIFKKSKYKPKK
jgi:gliding motility-associated lipoprotein GldB|tara:strand:- start:2279 stop:3235 length:957 start_codon:yes stop_codon:yes gene_type:complete